MSLAAMKRKQKHTRGIPINHARDWSSPLYNVGYGGNKHIKDQNHSISYRQYTNNLRLGRQCKNGGKGKNRARCSKCGRCPNEVKTVMRQMAPGFNVQQQEEVPSKHRCKDESTTLNAVVEKGMDNNAEIKFERMS